MDEKLGVWCPGILTARRSPPSGGLEIEMVAGHKIINQYRESGMEAFTDRSRRPYRQANRLPFQVEKRILQFEREWPDLGSPQDPGTAEPQIPSLHPPAKSAGPRFWPATAW